jgi:hypothetical protein
VTLACKASVQDRLIYSPQIRPLRYWIENDVSRVPNWLSYEGDIPEGLPREGSEEEYQYSNTPACPPYVTSEGGYSITPVRFKDLVCN